MGWLHRISIGRQIAFIVAVFIIWCGISAAWYVCGVNDLCGPTAQAAESQEVSFAVQLSDSQLPLTVAYDRAGAAADIFIMLLVAFVLGALLGRILSLPRSVLTVPPLFMLQSGTGKEQIPERIGTPIHISEFTKKVSLTSSIQKPITTMHAAPKPASTLPIITEALKLAKADAPTIVLGPTKTSASAPSIAKQAPAVTTPKTPAPFFVPKSAPAPTIKPVSNTNTDKPTTTKMAPTFTANKPALAPAEAPKSVQGKEPERPKLRFNTSWNNPYRGEK